MTSPLYIVRLVLDRRELLRVGARHHPKLEADEGYLLHAGLSQLFATSSERAEIPLHNFAVDDLMTSSAQQPESLFVLGYSALSEAALRSAMGPARARILRQCKSNPMPEFEPSQRLGFRTRVCPIARTRTPGRRELGVDHRGKVKCREMDAFVHATLNLSPEVKVDREEVYVRWLRDQLSARGGCSLEEAHLTQFQREGMHRRGSERMERPNALMEGTLTVTDPAAFRALLARGIGRHRAFGFGMLLLRPPSR